MKSPLSPNQVFSYMKDIPTQDQFSGKVITKGAIPQVVGQGNQKTFQDLFTSEKNQSSYDHYYPQRLNLQPNLNPEGFESQHDYDNLQQYTSQKQQIMSEKTNFQIQNMGIYKPEYDPQIYQKMAVYYNSNPLNVIPEHWELESKTSLMLESQSINKMITPREQNTDQSQKYIEVKQESAIKQSDRQIHSSQKSKQTESLESSKICDKKEKVEATKTRIKQLFLNYCDFSIDNGNVFITYTNFIKLLKDAKIIDGDNITQNAISIMLSKECNASNNTIKNISFEQFLNCILRISELMFPVLYKKNPKQGLQTILKKFILPLLDNIENSVIEQKEEFQNSLYSVSELTLKLIVYNKDTQVIFTDILPIFKSIYQRYFEQEIAQQKGKVSDLMKVSLKSIINFSRDFELCPYLVHQKACFLIWYSIAYAVDIQELTNNETQKHLIPKSLNIGKCFTLGHFLIFIYRLAVIYFNHSQEIPSEYNLVKKLLYFLRKLENSDGLKKFIGKLNRTYSDSLSFLPSKELLIQILKAEGIEEQQLQNFEDLGVITKEAMISRIVDSHLYPLNSTHNSIDNQNLQMQEEVEQFMQNSDDQLKKLFEIYCSFGEPMNTRFLKSSKLLKMLRECGLIKGQSRLPFNALKGSQQLTQVEIDLAFKQACVKGQQGSNFDPMQSQISLGGQSFDQSHQISSLQMLQSQMTSKLGFKQGTQAVNQSTITLNKTMNFDGHNHLIDRNANQGKLDFNMFKRLLELLAPKILPNLTQQIAFVEFIKSFLLPQVQKLDDKRCIHSNKIQSLLGQLDSQEMIGLLTLLHKTIIDIYKVYSDVKGYMNFTQFVSFCSDHDIFPEIMTKPALYRIFHSLSFINEILGNVSVNSKSFNKTLQTSKITQKSSQERVVQHHELIDEHLFVEALALCALFTENDFQEEKVIKREASEQDEDEPFSINENYDDETSELTTLEKLLQFIERMANSDGLYKKIKNNKDRANSIKCNLLEKKDLIEPFRSKYSWYFKARYHNQQSNKKKNFEDIMEMSSVWTNSSKME